MKFYAIYDKSIKVWKLIYLYICTYKVGETFRKIQDDSLPWEAEDIWSVIFPVRVGDGEFQLPCEAGVLKLEDKSCLQMVSSSKV